MLELKDYPDMGRISTLYNSPQILLGEELYWTEKRDGSQLRIAHREGVIQIGSHNMENASEQFQNYLKQTEQYPALEELLKDTNGHAENPLANFDIGATIFGELLSKGKSPARFEYHDKYEFILFDIWSEKDQRFLPYNAVYAYAQHYGLPIVEAFAMTRHTTLESLYSYRDEMLILCKEKSREGVVIKDYSNQVFVKEKLDMPKIERVKIEQGTPVLPKLPESDVMGAIAKVHTDIGVDFIDKTKAMPMIARYVAREMEIHKCSKPIKNLFFYYQQYIEGGEIK